MGTVSETFMRKVQSTNQALFSDSSTYQKAYSIPTVALGNPLLSYHDHDRWEKILDVAVVTSWKCNLTIPKLNGESMYIPNHNLFRVQNIEFEQTCHEIHVFCLNNLTSNSA